MIENNNDVVKKSSGFKVFGLIALIVAAIAALVVPLIYIKNGDDSTSPVSGTEPPVTPAAVPPTPAAQPPVTPPTPAATNPPVTTPVTQPPVSTQPPVVHTAFKDGSYSATGSYFAPSGQESIGVTLVLKNDVVTEASAQVMATNPRSVRYQQTFSADFASQVVGKKISDISLSNVSGASLTPQGFNDAVTKIATQAKV